MNPLVGVLDTARTSPVPGSIATSAAGSGAPANAASAASWTGTESVVVTGWGSTPSLDNRVPTTVSPSNSSMVWSTPPASVASYSASSPLRPTMSPASYRSPSSSNCSAVISPMSPIVCAANVDEGSWGSLRSANTRPGTG